MKRREFGAAAIGGIAGLMGGGMATGAFAQGDTIHVLATRSPAWKFYSDRVAEADPNGRVSIELMPSDKVVEMGAITMSSGSDAIDIMHLNDTNLRRFAANGWLEPLDDLWAKYAEEFDLADYPQAAIDAVTFDGHIYSMPVLMNTEVFVYRKDVFEENGMVPPTTMEEYLAAAQKLNSPRAAGTILALKPVDAALAEVHWYFNAIGDGWFDADWKPVFNGPGGVKAIEKLKEISAFAPRGFTSQSYEETSVSLQQGLALMGQQWFTRAATMDDPKTSRVVGKMDWVVPPGGGARIAIDGFAISKSSKRDKAELFRILAAAMGQKNMLEGAQFGMPVRMSVLEDPGLTEKYRWYTAARATIGVNKPFPSLPEFMDVGEIVTRRVVQAVTGEMEIQAALDAAAEETVALLDSKGYYKK